MASFAGRVPTVRCRPAEFARSVETRRCKIVFGSCRTAAPHDAPWSLELALDSRGRGVDALHVYAMWMVDHPQEEWPVLAVFLGDQIYADDSSPKTRERIAVARKSLDHYDPEKGLPPELVDGFEEYTWLYQESWSLEFEQWFFANVPTRDDLRRPRHDRRLEHLGHLGTRDPPKRWWQDHVIGGLMTYWLYQHLGNLSPEQVRTEGLLEALGQVEDGEKLLRDWAMQSEEFTPVAGRYRFSIVRDVGRVRLVMIDSRNVRMLEPKHRRMVDDEEWQWVVEACHADVDHLLIGTSLPAFVPGGLHDFQDWSEADLRRGVGLAGPKVRRVDPRQGRHGGLGGVPRVVQRSRRPARRARREFATGCSCDNLGVGGRHPLLVCVGDSIPAADEVACAPAGEFTDP